MTTYAIDVDVKSVTDESDRATATLKFKSRAKNVARTYGSSV